MQQDDRARFDRALRPARQAAFEPGEFVGQESFMRASEILSVAAEARITPASSVLDLCCGVAGPGRFITQRRGCRYLGVDASAAAVGLARERADGLGCRFEVSLVPPVPPGPFDVVLLLETMLALPDKPLLLREIAAALLPDGRFAFTLEEGLPLSEAERALMPDADTVWLTPLQTIHSYLDEVGLDVRWQLDCTDAHQLMADRLFAAFSADSSAIAAQIGQRALDELLAAHRQWSQWMSEGRVRKFAVIAGKARRVSVAGITTVAAGSDETSTSMVQPGR